MFRSFCLHITIYNFLSCVISFMYFNHDIYQAIQLICEDYDIQITTKNNKLLFQSSL